MKARLFDILHWIVILFVYTAFIWLDWKLVFLGVALYWLQIIIFKACLISIAQYKNNQDSFMAFNLNKLLGLFHKELPVKNIRFFLDWVLPPTFLALAYILQSYAGIVPLVKV